MAKKQKKKKPLLFRFIKRTVKFFHGKKEFIGLENLPEGPCIIVGNHSQMYGPILAAVGMPFKSSVWCVGEMMNKKESAAYAYEDFWSRKSKATRWFYKLISKIVGPFLCWLFNNLECIPVYKDMRALTTYKLTVQEFEKGKPVLIFPEERTPYNEIINNFQERYVETCKIYHKRTGKELSIVPMYYAVNLDKILFGKPINFDSTIDLKVQMSDISRYVMEEITALAKSLPPHKVVPYDNVSKRKYKWSKEKSA